MEIAPERLSGHICVRTITAEIDKNIVSRELERLNEKILSVRKK